MNLGAAVAGSSAMAVFAWSAQRVDARFNLGLKLFDPLAALIALATAAILGFVQSRDGLAAGVPLLLGAAAVCAVTDLQTGYIFDGVTLPAFGVLMICGIVQHAAFDTLVGGITSGAALLLLYAVSRGRGIGLGDAKLALCIGAAFGLRAGLLALCVSFILGGFVASMLLLCGKRRGDAEIRFGPFLALGSALVAVLNP